MARGILGKVEVQHPKCLLRIDGGKSSPEQCPLRCPVLLARCPPARHSSTVLEVPGAAVPSPARLHWPAGTVVGSWVEEPQQHHVPEEGKGTSLVWSFAGQD